MKICSRCKIEKSKQDFSIDKYRKDGLNYRCRECVKKLSAQNYLDNCDTLLAKGRAWRENNPEYGQRYYAKNRERYFSSYRQWYSENRQKHLSKAKQRRREDPDKARNNGRRWRQNNPEYFESLNVRIANALRARLYASIKNKCKTGSTIRDLGCSVNEFKKYIAEQFKPWMNWDNWALDTWHLDHKVPLSSFDLTNREEVLKAVHYTNYQPLSAEENLSKSASISINLK